MDRLRVWLTVAPLVASGVMVSHVVAYRLTSTPAGPVHGYLEHAPQLLLVLAIAGLALGGLELSRLGAVVRLPVAWPFPVVALATFVVQEHLERFVHTGDVPVLVGSRAFLLGFLLQVPVALVSWALARRLLSALRQIRLRSPRLPRYQLGVVPAPAVPVRAHAVAVPRGRGPPRRHTS